MTATQHHFPFELLGCLQPCTLGEPFYPYWIFSGEQFGDSTVLEFPCYMSPDFLRYDVTGLRTLHCLDRNTYLGRGW